MNAQRQYTPPGISPSIAAATAFAARAVGGDALAALMLDSGVRAVKQSYYHIIDVTISGGNIPAQTLSWFNTNVGALCNLQGNNLPNETTLILETLRFSVVDTGALFETATSAVAGTAPAGVQTVAQAKLSIINSGIVNLKIGDQPIVDNVHGLYHFPQGGGPEHSGWSYMSGITGVNGTIVGVTGNGTPFATNRWPMVPYIVLPGKPISLTVNIPAQIQGGASLTALRLKAEIEGVQITPANR